MKCNIKQLFFINIINYSENCISIFDFLTVLYAKNYSINELLNIELFNIPGIFVLDPKNIKLYMPNNNRLNTITIKKSQDNKIDYKYRGDDKFLSLAINNSNSNILNKIYLNISDCPTDLQEDLYNYRQRVLNELLLKQKDKFRKNKLVLIKKRNLERKKLI